MISHEIVRTTSRELERRRVNGAFPASIFRHEDYAKRSLTRLNIVLNSVAPDRAARLRLTEAVFGRAVESTLDLTLGEIQAFLRLAFPQGGITLDSEFKEYLCRTATSSVS